MVKKKILSMLITIGLITSMAAPAFADEIIADDTIIAVEDGQEEVVQDTPDIAPPDEAPQIEDPGIEEEAQAETVEDEIEEGAAEDDLLPEEGLIEEGVEEGIEEEAEDPALVGEGGTLVIYDSEPTRYVEYGDTVTLSPQVEADENYSLTWYDGMTGDVIEVEGGSYTFTATKTESFLVIAETSSNSSAVNYNVIINSAMDLQPAGGGDSDVWFTVNYGDTATLAVECGDPDAIITWENMTTFTTYEEKGLTFVTEPITKQEHYMCAATDKYGNTQYVYFHPTVENNLEVTTNYEDNDNYIYPVPGQPLTLEVYATAYDDEGITYTWYDADWQVVEEATTSEFTISRPKTSAYSCVVTDKYGSTVTKNFVIDVMNNLDIEYNGEYYGYVSIDVIEGRTFTIAPTVTGYDLNNLTYSWRDYNDNEIGTEPTYTTDPITEEKVVYLSVEDDFGNTVRHTFQLVPSDFAFRAKTSVDIVDGPVTLYVEAEAADENPIFYQWYKIVDPAEPMEIISEATESTYVTDKPGQYVCTMTHNGTEYFAYVTVHLDTGLVAEVEGEAYVVFDGKETRTLKVNASTNLDTLTYAWRVPQSSTFEPGTDTFVVDGNSKCGYYDCRVSDGVNTANVYFRVYPVNRAIEEGVPYQTVDSEMFKFNATKTDTYTFDVVDGPLDYVYIYDSDMDSVRYLDIDNVDLEEESVFPAKVYLDQGTYYIHAGTYDAGKTIKGIICGSCVHNWTSTVTKKATCTQTGIKTNTCTKCKATSTEVIPIDSNAHTWDEGKVTKEPTAVAEGEKTYTCKNNPAHKKVEKIAKLPATIKLNVSGTLPLKTKQTTNKVKVTEMAKGDSVASVKSSKEATVKATASGNTITLKAGKKAGTATVTVTLKSGKIASFKVKVQKTKVKTKSIKGLKKSYTLKKKQSITLAPIITPITTTDKLKFTSSKKSVATVSKNGKVTAKKPGKAVITVKSGSKKFKVKINVSK